MTTIDILLSGCRELYHGLQPYNRDEKANSSSEEPDSEPDDSTDNEPADDDTEISNVVSLYSSELGAVKRYRAFAEFEARTFFHNVAKQGRVPSEPQAGPADELRRCLEQHFQLDLQSAIEKVVATWLPLDLDLSPKDLCKTVQTLTTINTSMEYASNSLDKNADIIVSQTNDHELDSKGHDSDDIQQSLEDLHKHLTLQTGSCSHDALLKMTGFQVQPTSMKNLPVFELYLSLCNSESPPWQETYCEVARSIQPHSYDQDDDESDDEEKKDDNSNALCEKVKVHASYQKVLNFKFNQFDFQFHYDEKGLSHPSPTTHVTLRKLLDQGFFSIDEGDYSKVYSSYDRYLLGLNLARSLFYLSNGPWEPIKWNANEIFFPAGQENGSTRVYSRHTPYIRWKLPRANDRELKIQRKTKIEQLCYPMWLELAQILLELHLGRKLLPEGTEALGDTQLRKMLRDLATSELKRENAAYRDAIIACLEFGFEILRYHGKRRLKEERKLIQNKIISKLETNYKESAPKPLENLELTLNPGDLTEEVRGPPSPKVPKSGGSPILTPSTKHKVPFRDSLERVPRSRRTRLQTGTSILTLFDDESSIDASLKVPFENFFAKIALFNARYIEPLREKHKALKLRKKIKIAVLDSGLDYQDAFIKGAIKARYITDRWSPTGTDWEDVLDTYGHGTHVTRLLLDTAPLAEICVAKISRDKNLDESEVQVIADAIDWAVQTVNADIITMSFGMEKKLEEVAQKIKSALDHRKLVFAAASNGGGLAPRAYPACLPGVICIHATDGYGNPATFNPTPCHGCDNFSTVGEAIVSEWSGKQVLKSGTSFATPIAAGIAASILEFARTNLTGTLDNPKFLYSYQGMRGLLRSLASLRQSYNFIAPWKLFKEVEGNNSTELERSWNEVCEGLRNFIRTGVAPTGGANID